MKSYLIAIITTLTLTQCGSDNSTPIKHYTNSDLEGNWTMIKNEIIEEKQSIPLFKKETDPYINTEWAPLVFLDQNGILRPSNEASYLSIENQDLNFINDSIFWLSYPLELNQSTNYIVEAGLLKTGNGTRGEAITLSADKDTLVLSYLSFIGLYMKETYLKVSFNDSVLNILKSYNTNYPLLAGSWRLVRNENINNDGSEYNLHFPFDIPDVLALTEEELASTLYTDRSVQMLTNGKKRKYFLGYYDGVLGLTPGDWYDGDDPHIHFWAMEETQ